ncbi:N-acetylmuramoyl-L-alanine amidase, partial [Helicobacter pylori]|nr:N-acetylmuramoyl-L-alanine amidase [Helicobacter pylori]
MLVRLGVVACLFWLHYAYATTLKITNIVPFGSSSVKMVFNQEIKKFKEVPLKNFKSYLELEAVLTIPKKHYQFSKQSFITIAQFSPKLARVVIGYAPKMTYEIKILKNKLYVSIMEKKPLIRHQMTSKPSKHDALKHQVPKPTPKPIKKEAKEKTTKHARSKQTHSPLNERSAKKEIPKKEAENESKNQVFIAEKNDTWIKTKRKKHKKIVLDAGHGGKDCGAMSAN